jgi:hypothetical protein
MTASLGCLQLSKSRRPQPRYECKLGVLFCQWRCCKWKISDLDSIFRIITPDHSRLFKAGTTSSAYCTPFLIDRTWSNGSARNRFMLGGRNRHYDEPQVTQTPELKTLIFYVFDLIQRIRWPCFVLALVIHSPQSSLSNSGEWGSLWTPFLFQ